MPLMLAHVFIISSFLDKNWCTSQGLGLDIHVEGFTSPKQLWTLALVGSLKTPCYILDHIKRDITHKITIMII